LLRASNATPRKAPADPTRSRRGKLPALLAARGRPRNRSLEFSARDSLRNGHRRTRHRQHRDHETGRAFSDPRGAADGDFRGGRSSTRRPELIAFTGSREVGLRIWESAGKTRPGQRELKRVVCEMGGKNAVIVDSDADLDETIVDT